MLRSLSLLAAFALSTGVAHAASGSTFTITGRVEATVLEPLLLNHVNGFDINFGKFAGATGGTVVVTPTGVGSVTGGVIFVSGSVIRADRFRARGQANRLIGITTGSGTVTSGTNSMTFTTVPDAPTATIGATGAVFFNVGGTLNVGFNQTAGNYSGTYSVTVTYN